MVVSNVSSVKIIGTNGNTLCSAPTLSDGPHALSINLSGSIGSYTPAAGANNAPNSVWIDAALYVPSPRVAMNEVPALIVYPDDASLQYSHGWSSDNTLIRTSPMLTHQPNASVTFLFNGAYNGPIFNIVGPILI